MTLIKPSLQIYQNGVDDSLLKTPREIYFENWLRCVRIYLGKDDLFPNVKP